MGIIGSILGGIKNFLFKSWIRTIIVLVILVVVGYFGYQQFAKSQQAPQYQTAQVTKGTLITNVTASGQITSANNVTITIQASGAVKDVLVKNGDKVTQGQVIADLNLDQASQQKQAAAMSSYLSAKSTLDAATAKYNSLQSTLFTDNQKFMSDAVSRTLTTDDPTYIEENATWLQSQADYENQQGVVDQARAALNSSSLELSQTSSTITAPVSGTVEGLTITPGTIISLSSSSSSSTSTSQVLGSISQPGAIQAEVDIAEIDVVHVSTGQKVTMTLDAFPNETFTGKILGINTNGVVSSGVTTYPAVIAFDVNNDHIYPNMAVNASIITNVEDNVLLVPSGAVQGQSGQSTVRVLQNGQIQSVPVQIGDSSDTQTVITSGLSEGEQVVTGIVPTTSGTTQTGTSSPFGAAAGGARGGAGGAGGAFRAIGGGGRGG